jgi:hypothetical protein
LFGVFEGKGGEGAEGGAAEAFEEVIEQFVEGAEEIGVFSEKQVQVFFEFDAFPCLDAGVEQYLEQLQFFLVLGYLPHADQSLVEGVDKSGERVEMLGPVEHLFLLCLFGFVALRRGLIVAE